MAKKNMGMGLLPKLLLGVFIPILIVFILIGIMIFYSLDLGGIRLTSIKEIGSESLKELNATSLKESTPPWTAWGRRSSRRRPWMWRHRLRRISDSIPK